MGDKREGRGQEDQEEVRVGLAEDGQDDGDHSVE